MQQKIREKKRNVRKTTEGLVVSQSSSVPALSTHGFQGSTGAFLSCQGARRGVQPGQVASLSWKINPLNVIYFDFVVTKILPFAVVSVQILTDAFVHKRMQLAVPSSLPVWSQNSGFAFATFLFICFLLPNLGDVGRKPRSLRYNNYISASLTCSP